MLVVVLILMVVICKQLLVGSPGAAATAGDLPPNSQADIEQQYQTSRGRNISKYVIILTVEPYVIVEENMYIMYMFVLMVL